MEGEEEARELTKTEILDIIKSIQVPSYGKSDETRMNLQKFIHKKLFEDLKSVKVIPGAIPTFKLKLIDLYHKSLIVPGEVVGVVCGQNIGEPATQMTLNSFHSAGMTSKNMEMGIPRLMELFNHSKSIKTPTCFVYFENRNHTEQELWDMIGSLVYTTVQTLITPDFEISGEFEIEWWHVLYAKLNRDYMIEHSRKWSGIEYLINQPLSLNSKIKYSTLPDISPLILRLKLNIPKLTALKISPNTIANTIENTWFNQLVCIPSPLSIGYIDIIPNIKHLETKTNLEIYTFIRYTVLPSILTLHVSGILGIKNIYVVEDKKTKEFYIETDGGDLLTLFNNVTLGIDRTRTFTNDVVQMFNIFGIEGGRRIIYNEVNNVISYEGQYIHHAHISLLCDFMTRSEKLNPVSSAGASHTLDNDQHLREATFEKTFEKLLLLSVSGAKQDADAVSNAIILGSMAKIGPYVNTDILLDSEKYEKNLEMVIKENPVNTHTSFNYKITNKNPHHHHHHHHPHIQNIQNKKQNEIDDDYHVTSNYMASKSPEYQPF
jgi:DNA-directed RNA polymerase II subunit RPB1